MIRPPGSLHPRAKNDGSLRRGSRSAFENRRGTAGRWQPRYREESCSLGGTLPPIDRRFHFDRCDSSVRRDANRAVERWPSARGEQFGHGSVRSVHKAFHDNRRNDGSAQQIRRRFVAGWPVYSWLADRPVVSFGTMSQARRFTILGTGRFFPGSPELNENRFKLSKAVVSLKDGRVLIAGGAERAEIYDPNSGAFVSVGGTTLDGFLFSTATLLGDGSIPACRRLCQARRRRSKPRLALPTINTLWLWLPAIRSYRPSLAPNRRVTFRDKAGWKCALA